MTPALRIILMGGSALPRLDLNFSQGTFLLNGARYSAVTSLPGWTFTRATPSVAYAETLGGQLIPFVANTPRITDKGLLVEESRVNSLLWSEDFTQINSGNASGSTVTADAGVAPDGTTTADRVQITAATGYRYKRSVSVAAGTYTGSLWMRGSSAATVRTRLSRAFAAENAGINASVTTAWQRFQVTLTTTATDQIELGLDARTSVGSDGNAIDVEVWGFQMELGASASSYIPTTTAAVTRAADVATITGLGSMLAAPFTASIKVSTNASDATDQYLFNIDQTPTTNNDRISVLRSSAATASVFSISTAGGVKNIQNATSKTGARDLTVAFRGRSGATQSAIDGVLGSSDATAVASSLAQVTLGASRINTVPLNGYIQRFQVRPDVSDGQLTTLPQ